MSKESLIKRNTIMIVIAIIINIIAMGLCVAVVVCGRNLEFFQKSGLISMICLGDAKILKLIINIVDQNGGK